MNIIALQERSCQYVPVDFRNAVVIARGTLPQHYGVLVAVYAILSVRAAGWNVALNWQLGASIQQNIAPPTLIGRLISALAVIEDKPSARLREHA